MWTRRKCKLTCFVIIDTVLVYFNRVSSLTYTLFTCTLYTRRTLSSILHFLIMQVSRSLFLESLFTEIRISGNYLRFRSVAPNRLTNYATARECNYLVRLKMINDAGEGDVTTLTDRMVLQKR